LNVGGRGGNRAEDGARRLLLLERFAKFAVACLHFLEQAHILDGDYGLVGEGLH